MNTPAMVRRPGSGLLVPAHLGSRPRGGRAGRAARVAATRVAGDKHVVTPSGGGGGDPPLTDLDLQIDWSTATGETTAARTDNGKAVPLTAIIGTNALCAVDTVANIGLDGNWPTANGLLIGANKVTSSPGVITTATVQHNWGAPVTGEVRNIRYYFAMLWTDDHGAAADGDLEHGTETADSDFGGGDGWNPIHNPRADGTWWPAYREISTGVRFIANGLSLTKGATYRIEYRVTYGTLSGTPASGTYTVQCRIYNGSGTLIADETDYNEYLPVALQNTLDAETFSLGDAADHTWLRFGTNGPSSGWPLANIDPSDPLWAYGGVAIRKGGDWLGPYIEGESTA